MPPVASLTDAPSCLAVLRALEPMRHPLIVYSVDLGSTSATYPFGRETFTRREDAEQFIEEMRKQEPDRASSLRIHEHELEAGGTN
jgi:hypothetical protein